MQFKRDQLLQDFLLKTLIDVKEKYQESRSWEYQLQARVNPNIIDYGQCERVGQRDGSACKDICCTSLSA